MVHTITIKYSIKNNLCIFAIVIQQTKSKNKGGLIIEKNINSYKVDEIKHVDYFSYLLGLKIAFTRKYKNVIIQTYNNKIRRILKRSLDSIIKNGKIQNNKNEIHKQIIDLTKHFETVKFGYIKRGKLLETYKLLNIAKQQLSQNELKITNLID